MGPTNRYISILLGCSNNFWTDDSSLNKRADLLSTAIPTPTDDIYPGSIVVQTLHNHSVILPCPKPLDRSIGLRRTFEVQLKSKKSTE